MGQAANSAAAEWSQKFFDGLPHPGRTKDPGGDASASQSARGRATDSPEQLSQALEEPQLDQNWSGAGPGGGGPSTLNWGGGGLRPEGDVGGLSSPCAGAQQYGGHTSFSGWAPPVLQQPQLAPLKHPGEAEAELQRKTEQILVVAKQIQSIQAELQRLSLPPPPVQAPASVPASQADAIAQEAAKARVAEARELAAIVSPQLASMKDKLATTTKVARKLNSWFVENAEKMNIQDPQLTPSAFLERLLESAGNRMEVLAAGVGQVTEGVQSAQAAQPPASEMPKQQEVVHQPAVPSATIRPYAGSMAAQQASAALESSGAGRPELSPYSSPTAVAQPVSSRHSSGATSLQESSPQSSPTATPQPDAQTSMGSGDLRGTKPKAVPPPTTRPRLSAGQPSAEGTATAAGVQSSWSGQPSSSPAAPQAAMWVRDPDANQ